MKRRLELIRNPLTPNPSPRERGEGSRFSARLLVFSAVLHGLVVLSPCAAGEYPTEQWKTWLERSTNRYPQETWLKYANPEEAGWSSEGLEKARAYFDEIDSAAVMVVYDGAVLAAWGNVQTRYMCHSVRKSLLSALYGVHVAEGRIDLDKTLAQLNIDDEPPLTDAEKQARVIDLLTSRSGVYHPAAYETQRMKEQRPKRGSHPPGELFWYNNWDFNTLATIFEQETGTKVFEEFQRRFAVPLEMQDFRLQDTYYHLEAQHSIHPAYPFRLSARDMARLGLLFLRQGKWQGKQVLSEEWVEKSTASHFKKGDTTPNPQYGYGYLWWPIVDGPFKDLQMYSARGYGGHSIDVLPVANLVFVHRVDTFWDLSPPLGRDGSSTWCCEPGCPSPSPTRSWSLCRAARSLPVSSSLIPKPSPGTPRNTSSTTSSCALRWPATAC